MEHSLDLAVDHDFTEGGKPTTTTLLTFMSSKFENQHRATVYPGGQPSSYNPVQPGLTSDSAVRIRLNKVLKPWEGTNKVVPCIYMYVVEGKYY